ncbi:MAG: RNA polymerase sigma factor [Clostridiales bacterium]|nr:RNA polymerase sigma factor [Clostridiales bacterium]
MEKENIFAKITDEYSSKILNWAIKKTGNRPDGEDLAQEALLQIFKAVTQNKRIDKLEHFVWKVANYTWCNYVRKLSRSNYEPLNESISDRNDFSSDLADNEELGFELAKMRRKIANLSYIQREALILHYLDGLSIAEVAERLETTESTITWYLFEARKKIRKEFDIMKDIKSHVYRPGRLSLGGSGLMPASPDTDKINESLIKQNICLLCYREGKTIDELAELTGIPKPYLEFDLEWLVRREFLALNGKKYYTIFPIISRKHMQKRGVIYQDTRKEYIDKIIEYLWDNEEKIRAIGFYGSDFPTGKLMWSIIMMFTSYASRNSELLLRLKKRDDREIRPDGGRYYIMAVDNSDNQDIDKNGFVKPDGWNDYYGICSDSCATNGSHDRYYWLGVYTFSKKEYHPEIINVYNKENQALLHKLYCKITVPDFNPDELNLIEKEKLAEAVQDGLVENINGNYRANYIVMTPEQLSRLQKEIYAPLLSVITPKMMELAQLFGKMHKSDFPKVSQGYVDYHTYMDLWDFGVYTLMFAAEDKKLYLPETPEKGVPLTLVIIR